MAAIVAAGLTVTVKVNELEGQKVVDGKIVYVAVCATSVPFVRVPEIYVKLVPAPPPVNEALVTEGALQVYVVP